MSKIKWIFFDVGSTLVDETAAYDHRVRDMISGTNITFEELDDARIAFAQQGLDGNSAAIEHFGLTKTPWHSEDEVPYSDAHSTLAALHNKGYHLGIRSTDYLSCFVFYRLSRCPVDIFSVPGHTTLEVNVHG